MVGRSVRRNVVPDEVDVASGKVAVVCAAVPPLAVLSVVAASPVVSALDSAVLAAVVGSPVEAAEVASFVLVTVARSGKSACA